MILVSRAPAYATVQDEGRRGFMSSGVPRAGAMDLPALRTLNAVVGNDFSAAGIEWALTAGEITFNDRTAFAIGGAEVIASLNDSSIDAFRTYIASPGDKLTIETIVERRFLYIAFGGGIGTAPVMRSRSTYITAGFGGFEGRRLKTGDQIETIRENRPRHQVLDALPMQMRPDYSPRPIRFVARDDASEITRGEFTISPASDRTGYRLGGQMIFGGASITSTGVCPGTIQLPTGGEPIVLMADAPTVGGYRIAGCVISADLGRLAQLLPGAVVTFEEIPVEAAQRVFAVTTLQLESIREWALG